MCVLEIKNVSYCYKTNKDKQILNHVSASFQEGKMYVIVGLSGSGKTTLLALLAGLDTPQSGSIFFHDMDVQEHGFTKHRREHVSLVFQNYNLIDYMTPYENICLVDEQADIGLLTQLGLKKEECHRNVLHLSGGQQQRVAIARALASDAPVILADEPTGNLDSQTSLDIIRILKKSAHELNKCVIVVTHSKILAKEADTILRLKKGVLYEL